MIGWNLEPQVIRYAQDYHGPQLLKNYELSAFKDHSVKALTSPVQSSCKSGDKSVVTVRVQGRSLKSGPTSHPWSFNLLQLLKYYIALPISRRLTMWNNNNIAQCFVKYFFHFLRVI